MDVDFSTMGSVSYAGKSPEQAPAPQPQKAPEVKAAPVVKEVRKEPVKVEAPQTREIKITEDEIQRTIDATNKKIQPTFLEFHYKVHEKTNQLLISVVNTQTKEVVREIPPEKALDALAKMWELAGVLIDQKS